MFLGIAVLLALVIFAEKKWVEVGGKPAADLWTVMSGIGTVAATLVAIAVALWTAGEKNRDDQIRARLAAAQLAPLLTLAIQRISMACNMLDEFIAIDPTPGKYENVVEVLSSVVDSEPSFEAIRAVAPLPDNCAEHIASGFAQLKLAFQMLQQAHLIYTERPVLFEARKARSSIIAGLSKGVLETLQPAAEICNSVSKIKIGGPAVK